MIQGCNKDETGPVKRFLNLKKLGINEVAIDAELIIFDQNFDTFGQCKNCLTFNTAILQLIEIKFTINFYANLV